jgi:signal transduction histidine kinase
MRPGESAVVPEEVWLPVSAELIAGVHHALNNRVGALSAVTQVLEGEMGAQNPLRLALADEVKRLQATVRTLTLLPRHADATPEPVHLPDLLPGVVELYGLHHGVRDTACVVETQDGILPLYCEPTLLAHLLLTLLVAAGEAAREAGTGVRLLARGDAREVTVTIEPQGEIAGEAAMRVEALRPWADELGGAVSGGAGRYRLRLPTLPEVRRRERERGSR